MLTAAPRYAVPQQLDMRLLEGFDPEAGVVDLAGASMGTTWRVRLALPVGHDTGPLRAAIDARLNDIVAQMSHWSPTSLLSLYGETAAGSWTVLPRAFAAVMTAGLAVAELSGGAFDPALGRLTNLWGFGANACTDTPSPEAIAGARKVSGWRRLSFEAATGCLQQPGGLWLDLSGIAKGYAVDAVAELLLENGLRHALVEIGGECRGLGIRPDGDPWWVELETPGGMVLPPLRIALHELAVATSGDYLRGAHAIDPRTGYPVAHGTTAVSVLHASAMIADAWASALTVLDPAAASDMATREALAVRILGRDGCEWLSPALLDML